MKPLTDTEDPLEFAALIAHQLRAPLGAAGSVLKTVLEEYAGRLSPRQKDLLSKVDVRIQQGLNTVRRMLAILRPERLEGSAERTCDAVGVLERRQRRHAEEAAARDIALELDVRERLVLLRVSEEGLSEALDALISNAIKYTPDHGTVRLRIDACPGRREVACLAVGDSGIGVPDEYRDRVFEPFFRTPAAQSAALPGTGLGLAFVKALVESAGGAVRVERSDLGGAEFVLELPRATSEEAQARDEGKPSGPRAVVIGGVAAGPKVASKAIRLRPDLHVSVVERESFLSYSGCGLPYYVSGAVEDPRELMTSSLGTVRDPVFFQNVKSVEVLNRTEALEIDRGRRRVLVRHTNGDGERWLDYDRLVLATGSVPALPPIPGRDLEGTFTLHGMRDAEGIRSHLNAGKARDVVIVGGGLIGLEMTEALVVRGCRVTIVEREPQILGLLDPEMAALLERALEVHGVRVLTGSHVRELQGTDRVAEVVTDKGAIPADMVLLALGVRPNVDLARRARLEIGETGAIRVDDHLRTSDPNIYASGDCAETFDRVSGRPCYFPMGSTANKQGRVAAVNLCGGDETFPGVVRTCSFKVFDHGVARTGLSEREAREAGFDVVTALLPSLDREHFLPDAKYLMTKLVVDAQTRRILGAQCLGPGRAEKRIDVVATALSSRMGVDDLANIDLSYSPPFALAMDNLLTAANVARNKLDGRVESISPAELHERLQRHEEIVLLDVSSPREYDEMRIPGSLSIPLATLRGRLRDLPRGREIVAFCRISLRGYEAYLILRTAGFRRVRVLDGGVEMWPYERVHGRK